MAKGHWLDPLARSLLQATGRLPRPAVSPDRRGERRPSPGREPTGSVEAPAAPRDAAASAAGNNHGADSSAEERIERDLLALKLKQNPALPLRDAEEVRLVAALGWSLDVNRATAADWARLPGCRPEQIDLLLRLQAGGVQLSGPDDLQRLLDLEPATLASWLPLLSFQWYGGHEPSRPPSRVEVNLASAEGLASALNLEPPRVERLLRERRRSPFLDLADLQQRLQLPPAVVEAWIGKVGFEQRRAGPNGPSLPTPVRR